jgi:predicted DNA-binding transcriptional regulator AlpA
MKPTSLAGPEQDPYPDRLISIREIAVIAGVSVRTVQRMEESGQLPDSVYVRRSKRFWLSEVLQALEGLRVRTMIP